MRCLSVILAVLILSCQSSGEYNPATVKIEIELIEYQFLMMDVMGEEDSDMWGCVVHKTTRIEQGTNRMVHLERNPELNFQMECFETIISAHDVDKINEGLEKIPKGRTFYDFPEHPRSIYCGPHIYLNIKRNSHEQALLVGLPTEMPEEVTRMLNSLDLIAKSRNLVYNPGSECAIDEKDLIEHITAIDTSLNRLLLQKVIRFQIPSP